MVCDLCHGVIPGLMVHVSCNCGNISGLYLNDRLFESHRKDRKTCRVIGLDNAVRYGKKVESKSWVILKSPWVIDVKTPYYEHGLLIKEAVSCLTGPEKRQFNKWFCGQTAPLIEGKCGIYRHDLTRFVEMVRQGKPTYWD